MRIMWSQYINEIRRSIHRQGTGAHFRLEGWAMRQSFPFPPNWREEANTQEQLFTNYCGAMDVCAVYDHLDDKFDLSIVTG